MCMSTNVPLQVQRRMAPIMRTANEVEYAVSSITPLGRHQHVPSHANLTDEEAAKDQLGF